MCKMTGYDVCSKGNHAWIEPHFCRYLDCDGGMRFGEARIDLEDFYKDMLSTLRGCKNYDEYSERCRLEIP